MAETTSDYGKFLRDAIVYLIATRADNFRDEYGNDADIHEVPAFHYWVAGESPKDFVTVEGDAVVTTVHFGQGAVCAVRSITIEPTDEGFVVTVPHNAGQGRPVGQPPEAPAGTPPYTEEWQFFVTDAIDLYVGFGLADFYAEGGSYGELDRTLRNIAAAIEVGTLDVYGWYEEGDAVLIGDVQDDQDYAAVEYRLVHIKA